MECSKIFKPWKNNFPFYEEPRCSYRPGGYHPICLGDRLDKDRYQIQHKLGSGYHSIVWLARDAKLEKWVAIKVMKAEMFGTECSQEIEMILTLQGTEASTYIAKLLHAFIVKGPNGAHQCLVFELLGPSLATVIRALPDEDDIAGDRFEPETFLRITHLLLKAVASLHEAGYMHGNLTNEAVVFTSDNFLSSEDFDYTTPRLSLMSEKELVYVLGPAESEGCVRLDRKPLDPGMPKQIVKSADWDEWLEQDDEDIRLVGLGWARTGEARLTSSNQERSHKSPEALLMDEIDYRADLFSIGCVIYNLLFARSAFPYGGDVSFVLTRMINFTEELPKEWEERYTRLKETSPYRKAANLDKHREPDRLKREFDSQIHDPSLKKLFPVLKGLMSLRPTDRMEASEAAKLVRSIIRFDKKHVKRCGKCNKSVPPNQAASLLAKSGRV